MWPCDVTNSLNKSSSTSNERFPTNSVPKVDRDILQWSQGRKAGPLPPASSFFFFDGGSSLAWPPPDFRFLSLPTSIWEGGRGEWGVDSGNKCPLRATYTPTFSLSSSSSLSSSDEVSASPLIFSPSSSSEESSAAATVSVFFTCSGWGHTQWMGTVDWGANIQGPLSQAPLRWLLI